VPSNLFGCHVVSADLTCDSERWWRGTDLLPSHSSHHAPETTEVWTVVFTLTFALSRRVCLHSRLLF
jgi:hypothetical protein